MNIVTGACGFIGSNLVNKLLQLNKKVIAVDYVKRDYFDYSKLDFIYANDFYDNLDHYCKGTPNIFHEGAISSTTETNWKKLLERNVGCTLNLIYYCRDIGINLQYASSASVYGNPQKEVWHQKDRPLSPLNLYAKSKANIDYISNLVINSKKSPRLIQGMRYFNVYGPNEDHKGNQASPYHKFKKQLKETGKIKLFEGSMGFYRDFVSVEEIIEKKLNCIENKQSGIYDIGTGTPKSFYDVAIEVGGSDDIIEWIPIPNNLKEHYQTYSYANMDWYYETHFHTEGKFLSTI